MCQSESYARGVRESSRGASGTRGRRYIDRVKRAGLDEATKRTTEKVGCLEAVPGEPSRCAGHCHVYQWYSLRAVGTAPYVGDNSARFARDCGSLDGIYLSGRMLLTASTLSRS